MTDAICILLGSCIPMGWVFLAWLLAIKGSVFTKTRLLLPIAYAMALSIAFGASVGLYILEATTIYGEPIDEKVREVVAGVALVTAIAALALGLASVFELMHRGRDSQAVGVALLCLCHVTTTAVLVVTFGLMMG